MQLLSYLSRKIDADCQIHILSIQAFLQILTVSESSESWHSKKTVILEVSMMGTRNLVYNQMFITQFFNY